MTDRELMQQALDCLLAWEEESSGYGWSISDQECVKALRARLAQPEPEPVTMVISKTGDSSVTMSWWHEPALPVGTSLYTAPPQREWQGLTDEDWIIGKRSADYIAGAEWAEAKLKEKNT